MFVNKFRLQSAQIARQLNVPTENILGLAAQESSYGDGRIATEYNNYFSMHAPVPLQIRAEAAKLDPKVKVAVFGSFLQCGQSFVIKWGASVKNISDPLAFSQALVKAGYNTGNAKTGGRDGFAAYLAGIIIQVKARMECK